MWGEGARPKAGQGVRADAPRLCKGPHGLPGPGELLCTGSMGAYVGDSWRHRCGVRRGSQGSLSRICKYPDF